MKDLKIFTYNNNEVRTVQHDGEPWFVAADVCKVLEVQNPTDALKRLDEDEKSRLNLGLTGGDTNCVNEAGLYSLILGSRKAEAKAFKRWVTHEVLPAIRKTGGYVNDDDLFISTYLPYADEATTALFKSTLATVRSLNAKIESDKPKVLFADAVAASQTSILVGDLAKLIRQNGVEIGQTRLFKWLRDNKYLCATGERYNMPTQRSMDMKLFEIKETSINNPDGSVRITKTTKVTGKGQTYFINIFLSGKAKGDR